MHSFQMHGRLTRTTQQAKVTQNSAGSFVGGPAMELFSHHSTSQFRKQRPRSESNFPPPSALGCHLRLHQHPVVLGRCGRASRGAHLEGAMATETGSPETKEKSLSITNRKARLTVAPKPYACIFKSS